MAQETLLFRPAGFSPALRLLIPAFSLDNAPPNLSVRLRRDINAPLPLHTGRIRCKAHIFGNMLSPVTFSAQDLLISELLRTL
jgi:hypothetical protein